MKEDIALVYKTVLEEAGFNVDVFTDPSAALYEIKETYSSSSHLNTSQALEAAKPTGGYDLLLLDIKMPKMNGFELYREIKKIMKDQIDNNVKVCFITAYEVYYEQLKEEFPKINIACFIKKPIEDSDLVKRIKQRLLLE
jgi:CheY-like chemotaxis protein